MTVDQNKENYLEDYEQRDISREKWNEKKWAKKFLAVM